MLHSEPETEGEPEREKSSQRESQSERQRESQREPEREPQREPQRATKILSGSLSDFLWLTLAFSLVHSGSHWLSLAHSGSLWLPQASGSLRLSLALSGSPNLLTKPLLGSQGPCLARSIATALQHFNQPWYLIT